MRYESVSRRPHIAADNCLILSNTLSQLWSRWFGSSWDGLGCGERWQRRQLRVGLCHRSSDQEVRAQLCTQYPNIIENYLTTPFSSIYFHHWYWLIKIFLEPGLKFSLKPHHACSSGQAGGGCVRGGGGGGTMTTNPPQLPIDLTDLV